MAIVYPPQAASALFNETSELYRLLAETVPLMAWTANAEGGLDFVNQRVLEYAGVDLQRLEGWGWKTIVHPDDWERCLATWTRALQAGERSENEMRLRRADGAYRWHHGSGVPLRGPDGRVARWFGICTDIEDQFRSAQMLESLVEDRTRELREAQRRLGAIIDNEPECVKLLDAQGRLLEMNAAGLRMIEADRVDALLGESVYPLIAAEHREAFRELTERVCRGERGTLEFEIVGLKGTHRWLETHAAPFRDESAGKTRLLGITRDISDRKRAEHAMRETERRFQLFMDHLPALAWIRDSELRYAYVNRQYEKLFGFPRAQLLGQESAHIHPAPVAASFREADRQVQRDGVPMQYVDSLPWGRWLKVKFPFPDDRGAVGVAGIAIDITEQSRLEEALRVSEQRFRTFMDNLPARAWIKDARMRYTYLNRTLGRATARPIEEVLGHDDFELWPADVAQLFRASDEEAIRAGGNAVESIQTIPSLDGRTAHWLVVKFPLPDADGGTGVAGIAIDLTERVEADQKAARYAAEIRGLMDRLVAAQETERRRLADDLHDLIGQNLTALGIEVGTLKTELSTESRARAAPRLESMRMLVENTIDAIRDVMSDLRPAALEEFGLLPAIRWHASLFSKRTGMKVSTNVEGRELRLPGGIELALFRIVQESLTNAAKHSGGQSVEITLRGNSGNLRLTVEDDGRGFADPVGARSAQRGGWGLAAMRERAEAHGGRLKIEFPGRGTRVIVEIPAGDAD